MSFICQQQFMSRPKMDKQKLSDIYKRSSHLWEVRPIFFTHPKIYRTYPRSFHRSISNNSILQNVYLKWKVFEPNGRVESIVSDNYHIILVPAFVNNFIYEQERLISGEDSNLAPGQLFSRIWRFVWPIHIGNLILFLH